LGGIVIALDRTSIGWYGGNCGQCGTSDAALIVLPLIPSNSVELKGFTAEVAISFEVSY
jgi:hypothetical protein